MFKKSRPYQEPELFRGIFPNLGERKANLLEDPLSWYNVFYREITSRMDEGPYAVLYAGTGRPNAPVRQLVAMLILKEAHGWSDEQLYDACRFDLRVMRALGLSNLDDEVPVESTYYDFQARLNRHRTTQRKDPDWSGRTLLEQTFQQITGGQAERFNVPGKDVRMDSKLIQSNIARSTRLQLAIGTLQQFFRALPEPEHALLGPADLLRLKELAGKPAGAHTWPLSKEQKGEWLAELGNLCLRLVRLFGQSGCAGEQLLPLPKRLLEEQYEVDQEQAQPKDKGGIRGNSLQSPHDPDASYRRKESGEKTQQVQGFSVNLTETCDPGALHLITDVRSGNAATPDDAFFQGAIERTEALLAHPVENAWTDGAYNSPGNLAFAEEREETPLNWHLGAIQGSEGNFDFQRTENGGLLVTDRRSGLTQTAVETPKSGYRIGNDIPETKGRYRYIEPSIVVNYFRRKEIEGQPLEIRQRRPNVESTIHHTFYPLDGNQSKYRGLERNHRFALCRCFWVNLRRVQKQLWGQLAQKSASCQQKAGEAVDNIENRLISAFCTLWQPMARLWGSPGQAVRFAV
jgi:Transposase domain (DUF772)